MTSNALGRKSEASDAQVPAVPGVWAYFALKPDQIRWYYLRTPLSLKALYSQDILHRAHIQRFCTSDSNRLEAGFRPRQEELEKDWWEEQAELGRFATPQSKGQSQPQPLPEAEETSAGWQDYFYGAEEEVGQIVRGGLYEADLKRRRLKACYWPEPTHRILRGTWFVEKSPDWVPLKEAVADELEEAYRSEVWNPNRGRITPQKGIPLQAARVELQTLTNEAKGWFALFASEKEIYLCKDDSISWLSRKLGSGSGPPGMRLRRGYEPPPEGVSVQEVADPKAEEAEEAAAAQPVDKLLLVVHGIGQNLSGSNIASDAAAIRQNLGALVQDQAGDFGKGRIEVLPVQWRKHLNLDVDLMADVLMPPGVRSLRQMLHATAVEVLLYLTQLHCQEMLDSLVLSLNMQYERFVRRNPDFSGEVSILAHSLGSVLCYDILCNQPHLYARLQEKRRENGDPATTSAGAAGSPPAGIQPLRSTDLDPGAQEQAGQPLFSPKATSASDSPTPPAGSPVQAISSDLTDLANLASEAGAAPAFGSELEALRRENLRLKTALEEARRGAPNAGPTLSHSDSTSTSLAPPVTVKALKFPVSSFIAMGSPLGIFLTLRKVNPAKGRCLGGPEAARLMLGDDARNADGLPAVDRLYNLYHPFDPVGFRLEPLISVGAEKRRPVYAAYCKGGRRLHVGLAEFGEDVSAAMSASAAKASSIFQHSLSSLKLTSLTSMKRAATTKEPAAEEVKLTPEEEEAEAGVRQATQAAESAVWRLTEGRGEGLDAISASRSARGRLDFVLQSGNVENPWLSAMSSHFAYWASPDVALFILRALHHQDVRLGAPKQPPPPTSSPGQSPGTSPAPPPQPYPAAAASNPVSPAPSEPSSPPFSPTSRGTTPGGVRQKKGLLAPEEWW